jgi:hypothetical protein
MPHKKPQKPGLSARRPQPRPPTVRRPKPPALPIGPVVAAVGGVIERIGDMARALGSYEAFVTVMTVTGMVGLHYATDPWPTVSLVGFGVTASLVARFVERRR